MDALECHGQVGDREVRKGRGVPRTEPTLVDSEAEAVGVGLPPGSGRGGPWREVNPEDFPPEPAGATGVVGWELDQWRGHGHKYGVSGWCFASPLRRGV